MSDQRSTPNERVQRLAATFGLQLRRADHQGGGWHVEDPTIDGKIYSFAFTKSHTFSLDEIEHVLLKRAELAGVKVTRKVD